MKSIVITLANDKITLPAFHNRALQGVIYRLLSSEPDYSEAMHSSDQYKFFTYSKLNGKAEHLGRDVVFTGPISFEVRSAVDQTIDILSEALYNLPLISLGHRKMPVIFCETRSLHIYTDSVVAAMLTPITVHETLEDGKTLYYRYDEDLFYERIRENALRKYEDFTGEALSYDAFEIQRYAVRESDKNVSTFKNIYITGWNGLYRLSGDPDLLEFLYYTGIGDRNSQGYGMFKLYR